MIFIHGITQSALYEDFFTKLLMLNLNDGNLTYVSYMRICDRVANDSHITIISRYKFFCRSVDHSL